jgi:quercetin dioxygenase-like cupin family protein
MRGEATVDIDNDRVVVTRWALGVGEGTGPHRHARDYVVVPLTDGTLRLTAPDGSITVGELTAGRAYFRAAGVEHDVVNAGDAPVVFVETELKEAKGGPHE